jgi:hypothetical protein
LLFPAGPAVAAGGDSSPQGPLSLAHFAVKHTIETGNGMAFGRLCIMLYLTSASLQGRLG